MEFVRACLEQDERAARAEAARRAEWQRELGEDLRAGDVPSLAFNPWDAPGAPGDPARALAEVESKKEILKEHSPEQYWPPDRFGLQCKRCSDLEGWNPVAYPCLTVRLLVLPYANHPDYDPAWVTT